MGSLLHYLTGALLALGLMLPLSALAYDTYWGYFVCYDQNTRGSVSSCMLSTKICDAKRLHYYGQYNNQLEQAEGLLRCYYESKSVVDPVARYYLH